MSILYAFLIENVLDGIFRWGRLIDLLHFDILIAMLWIYNQKRWNRLKRIDEEER